MAIKMQQKEFPLCGLTLKSTGEACDAFSSHFIISVPLLGSLDENYFASVHILLDRWDHRRPHTVDLYFIP